MGRFKFSHLFYTIRTFIIKMTKHYFPLLLVTLLSDKPVLHPEKKLETSVSAGGQSPLSSVKKTIITLTLA